jgi:hypothetical protein
MTVKFLETTQVGSLYNEGEIATFDDATEEKLIDAKVAEKVKAPAKAEQKPAA